MPTDGAANAESKRAGQPLQMQKCHHAGWPMRSQSKSRYGRAVPSVHTQSGRLRRADI